MAQEIGVPNHQYTIELGSGESNLVTPFSSPLVEGDRFPAGDPRRRRVRITKGEAILLGSFIEPAQLLIHRDMSQAFRPLRTTNRNVVNRIRNKPETPLLSFRQSG